ncbi:MAG: hypothetical protein JNJ88_03675 [Planctomycetes bacterium]|nr:hypothetical protein [Planctomycetota bacterium]
MQIPTPAARVQGALAVSDALVGLRGDEGAVRGALGDFGPLWTALELAEKSSVLRELLYEIACRQRNEELRMLEFGTCRALTKPSINHQMTRFHRGFTETPNDEPALATVS